TPVKASEGDTVSGYLVRFTSADDPDLHGEYFDKRTYFWEKERPIKGIPILIDHAFDSTFKGLPVGIVTFAKEDEVGIWIEGKLKEREEYLEYLESMRIKSIISADDDTLKIIATNIDKAVKGFFGSGHAQWSGGSHPQYAETDIEDGHVDSWAFIEATGVMTPAEPDGTEIQLKSAFEQLDDIFTSIQTAQVVKDATEHEEPQTDNVERGDGQTQDNIDKETTMNREELVELIREIIAELSSNDPDVDKMDEEEIADAVAMDTADDDEMKMDDESETDEETEKRFIQRVLTVIGEKQQAFNARKARARKAARQFALNQPTPAENFLPAAKSNAERDKSPRIEIRSRYADWQAEDFSFADSVVGMFQRQGVHVGWTPDQKFYQEFADKAQKQYQGGNLTLTPRAAKSLHAMKADELDHSTQAGFGDEWVSTIWADNIWDKPRLDNVVQNIFDSIEMPSNPYEYPVESTDPTVYFVPETTDESQLTLDGSGNPIPDSKVATSKVTFTAKKLALRVGISAELEEDGIARLMPKFREQAERVVQDSLDNVALVGDTSTSGNINLDGGTPGSTAKYMAYDGLIHQALITATSNAINAGGAAPTLAHIRQARFSLGNAIAQNPNNLAIICDASTYGKLLSIDAVMTVDKYGTQATVVTGELGRIDGMPIFVSAEMALADADGKISDGGNTVNRGRLIVVHRPSWYMGFRRRVAQHLQYIPWYDSWQLVMTVRNDFKGRTQANGTQSANDDTVAVLYNIGV
ncbi:MAG: phage major capsid protein, partial [Aggregatilineales bacterium]